MITSYTVGGAQKMLSEIRELAKLALPASAAALRATAPVAAAAAKPRVVLTVVNGGKQHE
jgi:hypothetical protein